MEKSGDKTQLMATKKISVSSVSYDNTSICTFFIFKIGVKDNIVLPKIDW